MEQMLGTAVVAVIVVAFLSLLVASLIKDRKKGISSGCAGCPMSGKCHGACPSQKDAEGTCGK